MGGIVVVVVHMMRFTFVVQIRRLKGVVVHTWKTLNDGVHAKGTVDVEVYMKVVGVVVLLKED